MKSLLATTALLVSFAAPALAESAAPSAYLPGIQDGLRASKFIGKRVYLTEADTSTMSREALAEADANWTDAGEINDVIFTLDGKTEAVLVDFGGFLGIGEKTVAIDMNNIAMVPDADAADDYFIVFHGNKAQLEGAPAFDDAMIFDAAADAVDGAASNVANAAEGAGNTAVQGAEAVADGTVKAGEAVAAGASAAALAVADAVDFSVWPAEAWVGTRVYDANEKDLGEISATSVDANGKVNAVHVDVGGFLGLGEHRVALDSSMLSVVADKDGAGTHLQVNATEEQLKQLPAVK